LGTAGIAYSIRTKRRACQRRVYTWLTCSIMLLLFREARTMSIPIRIDEDLCEEARKSAAAECRTVPLHIV